MRYFRFRSGSHFGSKKGFFRQFLGFFGSQTSRTSRGTKKRPIRGRVWRRLGLYIYTQQREQRGATSGQKRGVFRLPNKQDVPGKGAKQEGGLSELPMRPYPGAAYGMAQMISSKYPGYLIYRTTYLTPHTVPHIWHLTFGTSYLAPHFGTSPRHLTFRHHISQPILPILTRYFS